MTKDLLVVELASVLAGPAVGMFFAELGARVIKIENKGTGGDVTRQWKIDEENPDAPVSAYYASVNWNKQSLFLDLSNPEDREEAYALIKRADVVVASFKKGADHKLGMDYETLKSMNPGIIYAAINGFGEESSRTAFDVVLQAESGFMSMNGEAGGPPVKMPVALIDVLASHQLKEAILLALWRRERTGEGAKVTVSLYEAALASLANQAGNYLMVGHIPQRLGSLHPNIAPYGEIFETADRLQVVLAIGNNRQFKNLCRLLQLDDLASDKRFSRNDQRVKNRKDLYELLRPAIQKFRREDLMEEFERLQVTAGAILNLKEVFEKEAAQDMILEEEQEGVATRRVKTVAFKGYFLEDTSESDHQAV